jgi:glycerate kinase
MRILIACDSFKGSLSSAEAAKHITIGIRRVFADAWVDAIPIADGGEGTALALTEALGGRLERVQVHGPMGDALEAVYGMLPGGEGVMDMASASGLTLVPEGKTDVMSATTYGTGQLISAALDKGCRRIFMGIGGSATNDGGLGMAQALGVRFLDGEGRAMGSQNQSAASFLAGKHLAEVAAVDLSHVDNRLKTVEISVLCDVTNPLCGPAGASYVYGPQKGAGPMEQALLDDGLAHLAEVVRRCTGSDYATAPGAGAAGGLGFGLMAFAGAKLLPGIDFMLNAAGFDEKGRQADLVVTGEGRLDRQSAFGKTPAGIARRGVALGTPVVAVGGAIEGGMDDLYKAGISAAEACVCAPMPLAEAMEKAPALLADAAERLMRGIALGLGMGRH